MLSLSLGLKLCRSPSGVPAPPGYAWLYVIDQSGGYQAVTVTVNGVSYPIYVKV